jgi:hypothetical protein
MKKILILSTEKSSELYDDLRFDKYLYNVSNKKIQQNVIIEIIKLISKEQIDTLLCDSEQINLASRILWQSKDIF